MRGTAARLFLCLLLAGCQSFPPPADRLETQALAARLDAALRVLAAPRSSDQQRAQADAEYRNLVASHLPALLADAARPDPVQAPVPARALVALGHDQPGIYAPATFTDIAPVMRPGVTEPGLHRAGLGLPVVGRIVPGGANAPLAGYHVPLTLVALPNHSAAGCCDAALVDPDRIRSVPTRYGKVAVAMDLEAPLDATRATGPRHSAGLTNLLRPERFRGQPRIAFLAPFDPDKTAVVLVHGLMSTPRMWEPLVKALLADEAIRTHYQFWFFYYPTSQPVPLSALQLREALDDTTRAHGVHRPIILVGHSMGGILARVQVSHIDLDAAAAISPPITSLPDTNPVRRALVFTPRADVSRVIFMFTPHRGSTFATNSIGAWGIRLIRLPETLVGELAHYAHLVPDSIDGSLPTSIHGLSPQSQFLRLLDGTRPSVPAHSIIGDRGRGPLATSSDGVVPYSSAHIDTAESEVVVPAGHGGIAHPLAIAELRRILHRGLTEAPAKRP